MLCTGLGFVGVSLIYRVLGGVREGQIINCH